MLHGKKLEGPKWLSMFEEIIQLSEKCRNNHNPKFATPISIRYIFEEVQPIKFLVIDVDNEKIKVDSNFLYLCWN
jgi:hypothetical protein